MSNRELCHFTSKSTNDNKDTHFLWHLKFNITHLLAFFKNSCRELNHGSKV